MKTVVFTLFTLIVATEAFAEPRVLVLPFDPIINETYNLYGEQVPILDYQDALQSMLISDLAKREEIKLIERAELNRLLKTRGNLPDIWNDPKLASELGVNLGADYVIIGDYGEFPSEIRADARIAIPATGQVPPGNSVTAGANAWEDLPTVASRLSAQIIHRVISQANIRPVSKGYLYPEGDMDDFDLAGTTPRDRARLTVWTNAPAPEIYAPTDDQAEFDRCDRIDYMNISEGQRDSESCKVAVLPSGEIEIRITHRGFLPYRERLNLAAGKAYRLEVDLQQIENERYR